MKYIAIAMAALLLAAGVASAELCGKCKGGMYIMSIGKCVDCGGHTGSGAFKLCKACSAKLGQCEHCRAPLKAAAKPDKPKQDKAKPAKPAKIDTAKSGVYKSGRWEYRYQIKQRGTRSERKRGVLLFGGAEVTAAAKLNDYHRTPWGALYWVGDGKAFGPNGWLPEMHGSRDGRELPPPIGARPYLKPVALSEADHGKTIRLVLGQPVHVRLEGSPATGFEWRLVKVTGEAVKWSGKTYVAIPPRQRPRYTDRAEGTYSFILAAVKPGRATVTLTYALPWEKDKPPAKTFKVTLNVVADLTDERVKSLKAVPDNFWLSLSYYGPGDNPLPSLRVRTPERASKPGPNVLDVHISRAQAAKIIDYLAADGLLARVENSHDKPRLRPAGPTYILTISSDKKVFEEDLGWNLATLQRLGALREALEGDAAETMDKLLIGLAAGRKQWEKILGPGYFMQEAAKVEKEIKIYIMQVRKGDNSGYGAWLKGRMGVMPFLVSDLLASDEEQVRREGLRLAQDAYYGRPELATEIANLLDRMLDKLMDLQTDSRMSACRVLGQWPDQGSVPVLVKALGDPYERRVRMSDPDGSNAHHRYRAVWWEADAALRKITGASPTKESSIRMVGTMPGQREACQAAWRKWASDRKTPKTK